jgi:enoyl-CoA hydratase/carnithine racemase
MSNALIVEDVGRCVVVKFNRPEARNPLSIAVLESLLDIVEKTQTRKEIRSLIFTGTSGVFASGANLREIAEVRDADAARRFALRGQRLMSAISDLHCDSVAAINGLCFGGALDLALSCGKRIASPDAVFSHPGANLGIITGWGGTQRLPRLVGEAIALEMFFSGKRVTAGEAVSIGLVSSITDDPLGLALSAQ